MSVTGYTCAQCGEVFGGIRGFDLHQRPKPDGRGVWCDRPASVGLRRGRWGHWVRPAPNLRQGATPSRRAGGEASEDGSVDFMTVLGVVSVILAALALGLALTAAAALGALTPAVTAAVSGAAVSVVAVCALLRRWSR